VFSSFTGALTGSANPQTLTMSGAASVTANFAFAPVGGFGYYYSDPLTSIAAGNWSQNGTLSAGAAGLTSSATNGGSLIATAVVPDGSSAYEARATLTLAQSGGAYITYLRASGDALSGPSPQGSYVAVELQNPTFSGSSCTAVLAAYHRVSGTLYQDASVGVPCRSGMVMRSVYVDTLNQYAVYLDNVQYLVLAGSGPASGMPGVGVREAPPANAISPVQLWPLDRNAPSAVSASTIKTSSSSNEVDLQWQAPAQTGVGVALYTVTRNGSALGSTSGLTYSDTTVAPNTSYTYGIVTQSYHLLTAATTVGVATPATPAYARRVGVRPTGTYWGGLGENLDLMSGNLNFTVPLLKAQARSGWKVGLNLTYNSENWRQDGGTWNLGQDVGYGYGWKLLAGSLIAQYGPGGTLAQYLFADATGAEYRLNVSNNGVWTSTDSIYVSYDSNANRVYFPDGSFWVMGCVSAADAGTKYPTVMEDTNGNQIFVRYMGSNSSARIQEIEDVRSVYTGPAHYVTYTFTYDGTNHLSSITNTIGTAEGYTFTRTGATLTSPFDGSSYGSTSMLSAMTVNGVGLSYQFTQSSSGELTKVTFPYGGYLSWGYSTVTYASARSQREVTTRSYFAGTNQRSFQIGRDAGDSGRTIHLQATLDDATGGSEKYWSFAQSGGNLGLAVSCEQRQLPGATPRTSDTYTWIQDAAGNWYVGTTATTLEKDTGNQVTRQTTEQVDAHGNLLTMTAYDYGGASYKTFTNTYLTDSNYTSRSIYNRVVTSTVSDGTRTVTLANNSYDNAVGCTAPRIGGGAWQPVVMGSPQDQWQEGSAREHDVNYALAFGYRGT
jgi:hypothetical protein